MRPGAARNIASKDATQKICELIEDEVRHVRLFDHGGEEVFPSAQKARVLPHARPRGHPSRPASAWSGPVQSG